MQFTQGTPLGAGKTQTLTAHSFPADRLFIWRAVPTTDGGRLALSVQEELKGSTITYRFDVSNTGSTATGYQLVRYEFR